MRYLTIAEILEVAEGHVGTYHLLDENRLHYVVDAVSGKFGDIELYPTLSQKAAVYAHHIVTGHVFLDGNKRTDLHCAILFLEVNGCTLRLDIDDSIIDLGFKIADGTITDIEVIADRIQAWIL